MHFIPLLSCVLLIFQALAVRADIDQQHIRAPEEEQAPPQITKAPELIETVPVTYPPDAYEVGLESRVVLLVTISATGDVSEAVIKESGGEEFDRAALEAIKQFKFSPAEIDGIPGPVQIEYVQNFTLQQETETVKTESELIEEDQFEQAVEQAVGRNQGPINLVGVIRAQASKAPIDAVEVSIEIAPKNATQNDLSEWINSAGQKIEPERYIVKTDEKGRFLFRGLPIGTHQVSYAASGYETSYSLENVSEGERTEVTIFLKPRRANLYQTTVRARKAKKEVAKISLTREEVRKVPGTFGDPIRVIENLPGLARAPFAGGALIVRGANPQNTGVYYDGVFIPLLYHFGGLKSVINPEFLEDISFYPGGFGAYYGLATAGIVDVKSRDLKDDSYHGFTDISLLDSGFFFSGPIELKNKKQLNFGFAARRSYIDALIPPVLEATGAEGVIASPIYWDYQAKLQYQASKRTNLSAFIFGSSDDLSVIAPTGANEISLGVKTTFHRFVLKSNHDLGDGWTLFNQPYYGTNQLGFSANSNIGISGTLDSTSSTWGYRAELRKKASDNFELAYGIDYLGSTLGFGFSFPFTNEFGEFPRVFPRLTGENLSFSSDGIVHAPAFYTEAIISPAKWLKIVPGLRFQWIQLHLDASTNVDGIETPETNRSYWNIDPRFTVRADITSNTTLKGAFGIYRQPAQGFELLPQTGNPDLDQYRAWQYIMGFEHQLSRYLSLDVQLYYINRDNEVAQNNDFVSEPDGTQDLVNFDNSRKSPTIGGELLLRHDISKYFYGWVAYTLSRSTEKLVDEAAPRVTNFDQTHILTIVAQGNLPKNWNIGGRFRYVTGSPFTFPAGGINNLDTTDFQATFLPVNSQRLINFHQLDIRVERTITYDTFSITPYLDLLNVYNRANAEQSQNDFRFRQRGFIQSLPIIPNFGIQGAF